MDPSMMACSHFAPGRTLRGAIQYEVPSISNVSRIGVAACLPSAASIEAELREKNKQMMGLEVPPWRRNLTSMSDSGHPQDAERTPREGGRSASLVSVRQGKITPAGNGITKAHQRAGRIRPAEGAGGLVRERRNAEPRQHP
jgi:hypothetical protein